MRLKQLVRAGMGGVKPVSRGYGGLTGHLRSFGGKNWANEVGLGYDNSLFYAAIKFAWNALTEVEMYVRRPDGYDDKGRQKWKEVPNHPAIELLNNPNPWYDGSTMVGGWVVSELAGFRGMSFTMKHRSSAGRVVALEYIPHFSIDPYVAPTSGNWIDHYRLRMVGGYQPVDPRNILAQRFGFIDPRRPQECFGPLSALLLEVSTEREALNFKAAFLENMGVTPNAISPHMTDEDGKPFAYSKDQRDAIQEIINEKTTGDMRGSTVVFPLPIRVDSLGSNLSELNLEAIHNIDEEHICAALRIPPGTLNLGTGLENSNNRASAEATARQAARDFTKPYMKNKARQLTGDLIPELGQPGEEICFRIEDIEALQEDQTESAKRDQMEVGGPWKTPNEKRAEKGLPPIEGGDVLHKNVSRKTSDEDEDDSDVAKSGSRSRR